MDIYKKTALLPGASKGIGRAIARKLAEKGVRLILPWHDWPDAVRSMKDEFSGHICIQADLSCKDEVKRIGDTIKRECGGLDILINNIERGGMPVIHGSYTLECNREQWQLEMETTLHAKWLLFDTCLPLLQLREEAAVINISSIAGKTDRGGIAGLLFNDGYAAANRGIESLTRIWAKRGAPKIRVNEIMLGIIDTRHGRGTRGWQTLSTKQQQQVLDHTLSGRTGTPKEVAETVLFILEKANYMTGSTLLLDGGFTLGGTEKVPTMPPGVLE
jgi:3-oxoacyl-[acyl-carrier protein] reductase